jgi:hypothetical protein
MMNCECQRPQFGGMVMPQTPEEIREILARYTALQIAEDPLLLYLQAKLTGAA